MARLTPKQKETLVNVAECWGETFVVYSSYQFLVDAGLVEKATPAQQEAHYARLDTDLTLHTAQIVTAVAAGDFREVKRLAGAAAAIQQELADRADDIERLVTLSPLGRDLADKLVAARAAAQVAR
jgi:hypothetical protein